MTEPVRMNPAQSEQIREQVVARLRQLRRDRGRIPAPVLATSARALGVAPSTLARWVARGLPGARGRRRRKLSEHELELYFCCCGNVAAVRRQLLAETAAPAAVPSLRTLQRAFETELRQHERAFARDGEAARRDLSLHRRVEMRHRNELWEADHSEIPVAVLPPRGRQVQKPWLTVFLDAFSRAVMGWVISLRPTQAEVLAALMSAVLIEDEHGPFGGTPLYVRWDNGLDWTADAVAQAVVNLGALPVPTRPYSPHEKGKVERFFGTVRREFASTKPYFTEGPRAADRELYGPDKSPLALDQLVGEFSDWVRSYNLERPHSALDGETPLARWSSDAYPVKALDRTELRWMVLPSERRKVLKDGIHHRSLIYTAPELVGLVSEQVEVRFMPHDRRQIEVFHDGQFIGEARPQAALSDDEWKRFLSQRKREKKRAAALRRRASQRFAERLAPITAPGPYDEITVVGREEADAKGAARSERDLKSEARADLLGLEALNEPLAASDEEEES